MKTKEEVIKKLYTFLDLKDNWDSYGAVPPNIKYVNQARDFITEYPRIPWFVAPGVNGEILVVYLSDDERYECFDEDPQLLISDENYSVTEEEFFPYDGEIDPFILNKYLSK